ncbi:uncharacterized protein LOC116432348 [Nomia melanderi]|uniref:uncharacterized protein LOC116432348 n=1 Tax=Nomia melanderi TaxID=2448451 RepID=UPI003FCE3929
MDVPRIFLVLLLLVVLCSTSSTLKNDRGGPSHTDRGSIRHSRRISLNEYLVPPPPPRHHPVRTGRLTNPQPTEAPGYFSKLMNWFSPFAFHSLPSLKPPVYENPFPPTPQTHLPSFNVHPAATHPVSSLHPPPEPPSNLPLYPPLSPPPGHSAPVFAPPLNPHPVPPLSPPPTQPAPIYKPPPTSSHEAKQYLPPPIKGKSCNPCNKVPWIPMQGNEHHPDKYHLPPQISNGYLPPSGHGNHDAQFAGSHQINIPDIPRGQPQLNGQPGLLPNPLLHPNPVPPIYKAEPFGQPSQQPHTDNFGLQPPSLPLLPAVTDEQNNGHFNGNHDLTSSGTQISQGHSGVTSQNHGTEINKEINDHSESFAASALDNQPAIYGPPVDQEYHDPGTLKQGHDGTSSQNGQEPIASFGSSGIDDIQNHEFASQNGDVYRETFESNQGQYLPAELSAPSFGSSTFDNQAAGHSNYQYSDDLSVSSSIIKDSHANALSSVSDSVKNDSIYFEESPLLDLTKKDEGHEQWQSIVGDDSTVKPSTVYNLDTVGALLDNSSSFGGLTESYASPNIQNVDAFRHSTPSIVHFSESNETRYIETSTVSADYSSQEVDDSYVSTSGQPSSAWTSFLSNLDSKNESVRSKQIQNFELLGRPDSREPNDVVQRQQNVKRNKQVQVIIPYTSDYTPIPFQQTYGDWSIKNNLERTEGRKVPPQNGVKIDNYLQQESRNEIRLINQLQSQFNFNNSYKANLKAVLTATNNDTKNTKANNSIDVRRLQKNIDNWTIQEYSKPTPSSTILPSSSHPYLLPSKKIPTEYLTTTEPGDHTSELKTNRESVRSYSLAGFSFNEVDHEGSSSNHIETIQSPPKVVRIETSKSTSNGSEVTSKPTTEGSVTWEGYSVSISPVNKEKVYVVTPQPVLTASKTKLDKQRRGEVQETNRLNAKNSSESKDSLSEFDAIEKAYQVLPQAVNNLAVASTGKEDVPLWGIMEHEEFAALNLDGNDDETAEDVVDGPVLYAGHSKVSRAKR